MSCVSFGWAGEEREVKVSLVDGVWVTSHFINGQPDPLVAKIFGSHQLATPWAEKTSRDKVVDELKSRNPHCDIN